MKKYIYILILMFFFVILPINVLADNLEITGTGVNIRSLPGTNGKILKLVNRGQIFELLSSTKYTDQGGCSAGWYKIRVDGQEGYVCSSYGVVKTTSIPVISEQTKNACEQELRDKGFPQDYWDSLCNLKALHPNWTFNAVQTGYSFVDVVNSEAKCGINSLSTKNTEYIDYSCTSKLDSGYSHASQKAVAYYLNPLNFLNEKNIFMFESNYLNTSISVENNYKIVNSVIPSYVEKLPTLPQAINNSCSELNISPTLVSSRIRQELGATGLATSDKYAGQLLSCISGEYTTRWNDYAPNGDSLDYYYNFFNANVIDGSNKSAAYRAVYYAYKKGWGGTGNQTTDLSLAISGGIRFLKDDYIDKNQYTMYFQKFNVAPLNTSHQYMSNLTAPSSESTIAYNAYKSSGLLDSNFIFHIPIYANLDAPIINSPDGATGENGTNTSNGLSIPDILVNVGYKVSSNKIMGIEPGGSLEDFKNKINSLGGTVVSTSSNILGTGNVIKISNGSSTSDYVVVIKGDTSGDGIINALDLLQIQKSILGQYQLKDANLLAGDPSGDGKVDALDLLQVQKNILGQFKINQ